MIQVIYDRSEFINEPGHYEDASVIGYIRKEVYCVERNTYSYSCKLKIRDCKNQVSFGMNIDNQEDFDNSVSKLNKLIDNLSRLRDAILKQGVSPKN